MYLTVPKNGESICTCSECGKEVKQGVLLGYGPDDDGDSFYPTPADTEGLMPYKDNRSMNIDETFAFVCRECIEKALDLFFKNSISDGKNSEIVAFHGVHNFHAVVKQNNGLTLHYANGMVLGIIKE